MTVDVSIRVEGADELRRAFRTVDRQLGSALAAANKAAAKRVVDAALPHVPTRSGKLKQTVRALGSQRSGRAVAGRGQVDYAAAVHWGRLRGNVGSPPGNHRGNNRIKANPFLWEAAQREVPRIEPDYRTEIMRLINEAIARSGAL